VTSFTVPDTDNELAVGSPAQWATRAPGVVTVVGQAMWWWGDLLSAAPSPEARAEVMQSDPRLEPAEAGKAQRVAEMFPPERRRMVPWVYHLRLFDSGLPDHTCDVILELAEQFDLPLRDVEKTITRYKQGRTRR